MSMNFGRVLRLLSLTLALLLPAVGASAQTPVPPGPNALTGPNVSNEQLLFQQLQGDLRGRVSIPDQKSAMLIQPEGPEWRTLRNGMLKTIRSAPPKLESSDVAAYLGLQRVARELNHPDVVEHWKSSPYPLNFMDEYQLKRKFVRAVNDGDASIAPVSGDMRDGLGCSA